MAMRRVPGAETLFMGGFLPPDQGPAAGPPSPAIRIATEESSVVTTTSITITERAAERIAQIVCNEPGNKMFRVSVEGGGCSGFEYCFDLVPGAEPQDAVIERADAKVLVDSLSLTYLAGSEIDYVDDLMGASFKIKNPNATAACGCGTSFSV
jgi:iron-sulfur cluster assembly accessory protein